MTVCAWVMVRFNTGWVAFWKQRFESFVKNHPKGAGLTTRLSGPPKNFEAPSSSVQESISEKADFRSESRGVSGEAWRSLSDVNDMAQNSMYLRWTSKNLRFQCAFYVMERPDVGKTTVQKDNTAYGKHPQVYERIKCSQNVRRR
jgi:hypothetical protein